MAGNKKPLSVRARNRPIRVQWAVRELHRFMAASFEQPGFLPHCPDRLYPVACHLEYEILAVGGPNAAAVWVPPIGKYGMQVASAGRYFPNAGGSVGRKRESNPFSIGRPAWRRRNSRNCGQFLEAGPVAQSDVEL